MERIFKAAKANGHDVFISPHYFYPTDIGWKFNGPLETDEFRTHSFCTYADRLNLTGFSTRRRGLARSLSSPISKTARRSSSARTKYGGRKRVLSGPAIAQTMV